MKKHKYIIPGRAITALAASLIAAPVMAANENPFQMQEAQRLVGSNQKLAQGMCGGGWEGRCGGMMNGVMPRALGPEQLLEPNSAGAKLLTQYCTQCHALPNPKQHSASGWSITVARMNMRMQWMSRNNNSMKITVPTEEELRTLTAYLEKYATDPEAMTTTDKSQNMSTSPVDKTVTEILRERYARGEIDREDFLQRLEDLSK